MTEKQSEHINLLRELVEQTANRKIKTPADFNFLAGVIMERTGETISTSTLKRIWGYIEGYDSTRNSSLNILSQCVGYRDWDTFENIYCSNIDKDASRAIMAEHLYSRHLAENDIVVIEWAPLRHCELLYLGDGNFKVLVSVNSKLQVDDIFHASLFILHQPLYIDNLVRNGCKPTMFVVGNKGGLSKIKRIANTSLIEKGLRTEVEICAPGRRSAENAVAGGAMRIELCKNLEVGGLTPDLDDIAYCVKQLGLRTHVLIRPRGGDFCYTDKEFTKIIKDIVYCRKKGVHSVVVGFLTPDNRIDIARTKMAVAAAQGMEVTFHRAFDRVTNPAEALEEIIDCGCKRVLTSGCRPTAEEGIPTLRQLVWQARDRIKILAGSGITPDNVQRIIRETDVPEVHASCKAFDSDNSIVSDSETVKKLITKVRNIK
jgi:copper homeostasis protein